MEYEIVELEEFCGGEAKVYSIIPKGENETLFDKFIDEYKSDFKPELKDINKRLVQIGKTTGARHSFFKHYEGKYGDFVCALYDEPESKLRLYCIRYGTVAVILGGGGEKEKSIKAWQEDEKLSEEANKIIAYANDISKRISNGEIYWSKDKTELEGNLKTYEDDENN